MFLAADCETDGYLSPSGLQEPPEASRPTPSSAPSVPAPLTEAVNADAPVAEAPPTEESPEANALIPALCFPSVSSGRGLGSVNYKDHKIVHGKVST